MSHNATAPKKRKIPQRMRIWLRYQMIQRDGTDLHCHWCSVQLILGEENYRSDKYATIEHLVRVADGGTDELSNLTWACPKCNNTRHTE